MYNIIVCFVLSCFFMQAILAEQHLRIVGSSSVYPFIAFGAEQFARNNKLAAPIVESTGTGAGINLFCTAKSSRPEIVMASRLMSVSEVRLCASHGIYHIETLELGLDGIVLISSNMISQYDITLNHLFQALDKEGNNPIYWSDIDHHLPQKKILIYGPASGSGTRADFEELVMKNHLIREDGAYIAMGNNTNLIIQKIANHPYAIGIIGYNFLEHNLNKVHPAIINSYIPNFINILSSKYPLSRRLYLYINKDLLNESLILKNFIEHIKAARTGYMKDYGLVPVIEK